MKRSKKLAVAGLVGIVCLGATYTAAFASDSWGVGEGGNQPSSGQKAKNVIFLIPDGFSQGYTNNYRLYKEDGGQPIWDERNMLRAFVQTHSANAEVTDSAADTALATGEKTNNGMIGVTPDGQTLSTILDSAKKTASAQDLWLHQRLHTRRLPLLLLA